MARESVGLRKIVENKLYTISEDGYDDGALNKVTAIVNLTTDPGLVVEPEPFLYVCWSTSRNVNRETWEGLVRLCSSMIKGKDQRVLVIGLQATIDTLAACVLREYLGVNAETAVLIIRTNRTHCLNQSILIETINGYKPS